MFGLSDATLKLIITCLRQYSLKWVKIYGSRAKGNYHPGSDIDLAFSANEDYSAKLREALDSLKTPYLFDVSYYEGIENKKLKDHIDRIGITIYP